MEVKIVFSGKPYDPGEEYEADCEVHVNGKMVARVCNFSEMPEDANLGRALGFVYCLPDVLKSAYEAGRNGEDFTVQEISEWG